MTAFHDDAIEQAILHFEQGLRQGSVVLDLGCGVGAFRAPIVAAGFRWVGVDCDHVVLAGCRRVGSRAPLIRADAHRIPVASSSVDAVLSISLMQYVDRRQVVSECHRVLKPGGRAVFVENLRGNPLVLMYRGLRRVAWTLPATPGLRRIAGDKAPSRHLSWAERRDFVFPFQRAEHVAQHLLTPTVLVRTVIAPTGQKRLGMLAQAMFLVLSRIDRFLLDGYQWLRPLAWMVVVKAEKGPDTAGDARGAPHLASPL